MQLRAMLIRWKEDLDIPVSNENLSTEEVHKEIKGMLQGKDWQWSDEDSKAYKAYWKIDGQTTQSLPGDLRAWRRHQVEPGKWQFVLPAAVVGKVGESPLDQVTFSLLFGIEH